MSADPRRESPPTPDLIAQAAWEAEQLRLRTLAKAERRERAEQLVVRWKAAAAAADALLTSALSDLTAQTVEVAFEAVTTAYAAGDCEGAKVFWWMPQPPTWRSHIRASLHRAEARIGDFDERGAVVMRPRMPSVQDDGPRWAVDMLLRCVRRTDPHPPAGVTPGPHPPELTDLGSMAAFLARHDPHLGLRVVAWCKWLLWLSAPDRDQAVEPPALVNIRGELRRLGDPADAWPSEWDKRRFVRLFGGELNVMDPGTRELFRSLQPEYEALVASWQEVLPPTDVPEQRLVEKLRGERGVPQADKAGSANDPEDGWGGGGRERKADILTALLNLKAFDRSSRRTCEEVAEAAGGKKAKPSGYSKPLSEMAGVGRFVKSSRGSGSGYWLTPAGRAEASRNSPNSGSNPARV